ncbi:MAG TPA: amino acid adenylation domain-containing protein, partial [Ktedonobacteraceae bacterium]
LTDLAIQYADFAAWQRARLQTPEMEEHLSYWKGQLHAAPALQLPMDFLRPAIEQHEGHYYFFTIDKALSDRLNQLSQQENATLFMTLFGAFAVLLARYSAQKDLLIGTPIANRTRPELENLMGFLVNTLVLRADLTGNPSFREVIQRVRQITLEAYAHQDLPFEKLVEELQPERDLSRNPLFQVFFQLQNFPATPLHLAGLTTHYNQQVIDSSVARFDLTMVLEETVEGLQCGIEYNTALFKEERIARMARHFQALLQAIVEDPAQRIELLPVLTAAEWQHMIVEWNQTYREPSPHQTVVSLFEAQVERTPESIAIVFEESFLTYREVNQQVHRLAWYLKEQGVGPEVRVGICLERSLEMIIALLAILKAGGAYVPLDPTYPRERLAFMIRDAGMLLVLTQQHLREKLFPITQDIPIVIANGNLQGTDVNKAQILSFGPLADNLAYIIYTSGSTGTPKGVAMQHKALINLISWQHEHALIGQGTRTLQFTTLSFDASFLEIFATLGTGGTLVLITEDSRRDFPQLLRTLAYESIDHLFLPFIALQHLAEEATIFSAYQELNLREIITAGEQLQITPSIANFISRYHISVLHNQYGPTESHVVSQYSLTASPDTWPPLPPIGQAIANTELYVLDQHCQPVPIGVVGELYIGGDCLSRGYLNRPAITAEKFIPHPFSQEGARLYRTGDQVRWLDNGTLEYIGRIDHQIKLRGYRIEVGEIETLLRLHPQLQDAVVVARESTVGDKRLIAYIVVDAHRQQKEEEQTANNLLQANTPHQIEQQLRALLKERLPEYMIPSIFVALDHLPLTPTGKVDREALPAPDTLRAGLTGEAFVAPHTATEQMLTTIWADVLQREKVSITASFFDLGGHSLLAAQLVARVRAALDVALPIRTIFEKPVLADLAKAVDMLAVEGVSDRVEYHLDGIECSPDEKGDTPLEEEEAYNQHTLSPFLQLEPRALWPLFATGELAPVDAAALGYVSTSFLVQTGLRHDELLHAWYENRPTVTGILTTRWGRTALLLLPYVDVDLYNDRDQLVRSVIEALEMAGHMGARTVSLTGLIPSATNYGMAINAAIAGREHVPAISTGHATTSAAIILAVERILQESTRILSEECVLFLGLGSIGMSALRLMLQKLPHPRKLVLCDIYSNRASLEKIRLEVINQLAFLGDISIATSEKAAELHQATLIIGATNVPDLISVAKLQPGTMIVDDSAPHCFKIKEAIQRFEEQGDILFTEGGMLHLPDPVDELRSFPPQMERLVKAGRLKAFYDVRSFDMTGCVLSSLLSSTFQELKPTSGIPDGKACLQHYEALVRLDIRAADLHCEDYVLSQEAIQHFQQRFGYK